MLGRLGLRGGFGSDALLGGAGDSGGLPVPVGFTLNAQGFLVKTSDGSLWDYVTSQSSYVRSGLAYVITIAPPPIPAGFTLNAQGYLVNIGDGSLWRYVTSQSSYVTSGSSYTITVV